MMTSGDIKKKLSWATVAILTTGNQVCMKYLAVEMQGEAFSIHWLEKALRSPWIAGIAFCEIISFILWMRILSTTEISRAVPLTAMAYVLILAMSKFVFHETIVPLQMLGIGLILGGVWLVSRKNTMEGSL